MKSAFQSMATASCTGKRFGHNFVGDVCLNGCGMRQSELSHPAARPAPAQPDIFAGIADRVMTTGMHSPEHALAKDVSEWAGEGKSFSKFLGTIKRIGIDRAFMIFSQLRDRAHRERINNRGAMFMAYAKTKNTKTK